MPVPVPGSDRALSPIGSLKTTDTYTFLSLNKGNRFLIKPVKRLIHSGTRHNILSHRASQGARRSSHLVLLGAQQHTNTYACTHIQSLLTPSAPPPPSTPVSLIHVDTRARGVLSLSPSPSLFFFNLHAPI